MERYQASNDSHIFFFSPNYPIFLFLFKGHSIYNESEIIEFNGRRMKLTGKLNSTCRNKNIYSLCVANWFLFVCFVNFCVCVGEQGRGRGFFFRLVTQFGLIFNYFKIWTFDTLEVKNYTWKRLCEGKFRYPLQVRKIRSKERRMFRSPPRHLI